MFESPDPTFEPSSQTKEAMVYVRKRPVLVAGINHPGYFDLHGYTSDWIKFLLALCLEFLGLYAIFSVLQQSEVGSFAAAVFIALSLFALDLVLAIAHHRFSTGINSTLEMKALISTRLGGTSGNIDAQNITDRLSSRKRMAFILSLLILLAAAVKFATVFFLNPDELESVGGLLIFLAIAYSLTAVIHIRSTGYLLHALWASWFFNRDVKLFKRSKGTKNRIAQPHVIDMAIHDAFRSGIQVNEHEIKVTAADGTSPEMCLLICRGILYDSEIEQFGNKINDDSARTEFVLRAMELQTRIAAIKL
jgi:hypothetical protein